MQNSESFQCCFGISPTDVKLYQVYGQAEQDWKMADYHENVLYSETEGLGKEQYCVWSLQSPVI